MPVLTAEQIRLAERLRPPRSAHPRCECHACTQARWIMSGQNSQESLPGPSGWNEDGDHLTAEFYKWKSELFNPLGVRTVR
jgi:hypothetical protein